VSPVERFVGSTVRVNVRYINDIEALEGIVMDAGPIGIVMRSGARGTVRLVPWTSVVTVLVVDEKDPEDFLYQ
jgi:hypothetical protein